MIDVTNISYIIGEWIGKLALPIILLWLGWRAGNAIWEKWKKKKRENSSLKIENNHPSIDHRPISL